MARPSDPRLAQFYDTCRALAADETSTFYHQGRPTRGAGHRDAYWSGRGGNQCRFVRFTFAWAAWRAGADDRLAAQSAARPADAPKLIHKPHDHGVAA